MNQRNVTLLLPGYTTKRPAFADHEPDPDRVYPAGIQPTDRVESSGLAPAIFSFSDDLDRQPWQSQLAEIFRLDTTGGKRLPGARLGLLDVGEKSPVAGLSSATGLVRADPIFLKADRDNAILIPPEQLRLSEEEAAAIIATLNDFVADDGLRFSHRGASEWYLCGMSADYLETYPPSFLAKRNASSFLPDGDGAAPWRRLMTEIQMLLHSHAVNQKREQRGLMPVNSVWFWGGAALPEISINSNDIIVYADNREARLLVQYLDSRCLPLANALAGADEDTSAATDRVIIDLSLVEAWINDDARKLEQELVRINEQWLEPLSAQVSVGQLEQVRLLTEDGLQGLCNRQTQREAVPVAQGWIQRLGNLFSR